MDSNELESSFETASKGDDSLQKGKDKVRNVPPT